jgi:hypothetical protein
MTRYLLHIGLPKTGTKYLQTNLRRLNTALAERGVIYPADWWKDDREVNHDRLIDDLREGNADALRPAFERLNATGQTVLLSCEGLAGLAPNDLGKLQTLIDGHPVEIILYCRRWSDWIPSAWQQVVKEGSGTTLPEYIAYTLQHSYSNPAMNLGHIVDAYSRVFPNGNIKVISYSNLTDEKRDIAEEFFRSVLQWHDPPLMQRAQVHESLGIFRTELVRLLNSLCRRRGIPTDVAASRLLEIAADRADLHAIVEELIDQMRGYVGEIEINDASPGLRGLLADLNGRYGDLMLREDPDASLFAPRRASVPFVRQDYLAEPAAAALVQRIFSELESLSGRVLPDSFDEHEFERFAHNAAAVPALRFASAGRAADYLSSHPATSPTAESALDVHIDAAFGPDVSAHALLRAGWSRPEARFVWSNGTRVELALPRPTDACNLGVLLVFRTFTRDSRLPFQRLEISINGQAIGRLDLAGYIVAEARLPSELLASRQEIELSIDLPKAARPVDFGGSSDRRQLGVSLERVIVFSRRPHRQQERAADRDAGATMGEKIPTPTSLQFDIEHFESLGENCEFGLVQRACGIEPLGLLRFSSTPLPPLLKALRARFAGMGRPEFIDIEVANSGTEYMVFDKRFHFRYHAWVKLGEQTPEEIHARECRRLPLLVRKLIEDLTEGRKIFVYRGLQPLAEPDARELAAAIGAYGPGTLLWVERADAANPPGSVLRLGPTLLKGHIDRFAPPEDAHDLSLDCWITICRNALAMAREAVAG